MTAAVVGVLAGCAGALLGWFLGARRAPSADGAGGGRPSPSPAEPGTSTGPGAAAVRGATLGPAGDGGQDAILGALSEAVQRIEHGVVVVDGDGVERFRNRAAEQLATARHGHALVENCMRRLLMETRDGRSHREAVELFGPPAELLVVTAHPFHDATGHGGLAVVEDRSAARRTETVRRDFVANISHELKTPIGALGLLAETIEGEPDPEVVGRLAQRMSAEAARAAHTIDDLLELSRIEFADDAVREDLYVAEVVAEAVSRMGTAAEHAGVEVQTQVPGHLMLVGDRRQLTSAVFNLLDNAVKYSPAGSRVEVRAHQQEGGEDVAVVVEDQGMGIPRRCQDRIFERFYRVDRARSRNTGGTGLGLAIVRHVVSNHGGEVTVDSLEGRGSVFTLVLPCSPPPPDPTPTTDPTSTTDSTEARLP